MSSGSTTRFVASLLALTLCACTAYHACPLDADTLDDPVLRSIHARYAQLVDDLHADPATNWHAGWQGNALVHVLPGRHMGLCVDWQREVYFGLREHITAEGWQAVPIAVRVGTIREHHAVLVYDPKRVSLRLPDIARPSARSFVLDPWKRGRPDMFSMHDWLRPYAEQHPPFLIERLEPDARKEKAPRDADTRGASHPDRHHYEPRLRRLPIASRPSPPIAAAPGIGTIRTPN